MRPMPSRVSPRCSQSWAKILLGKDPRAIRPLLDDIASVSSNGFALGALSIALDDLRARLAGVPVFALYGGRRRESVRAYASSGGYLDEVGPEVSWPRDVSAAVEAGFSACKVRIGRYSPARELPLLSRLRADSAPGLELMVDANGAYSGPTAVEVGRALGQFGYKWLEEPLTRTRGGLSYPGYEALPPALDIAIAGGEGLETRGAFAEFLNRRGRRHRPAGRLHMWRHRRSSVHRRTGGPTRVPVRPARMGWGRDHGRDLAAHQLAARADGGRWVGNADARVRRVRKPNAHPAPRRPTEAE